MARGRDYAGQHRQNQNGAKGGGKSTRRKPGSKAATSALSLWAWMAIAISVILLGAVVYTISRPAGPLHLSPTSETVHSGKNKPGQGSKVVIPPREKPAYDFYTMLPNEQVGSARPNQALGEARPPPTSPEPAAPTPASLSEQNINQALQEAAVISGAVVLPASPPAPRPATAPKPPLTASKAAASSPATVKPAREPPPTVAASAQKPPPKPEAAVPVALAPKPVRSAPAATLADPAMAFGGHGRFAIQTAAYRSRSDAEHQRASLALNGLNARIEEGEVNGQTWYRVRMGPFSNRDTALSAQARLSASGFKGVLLPLPQ